MKRMFDLIAASLLLAALLPLMVLLAVLVRTKLGSPVLFKQERPGLHGRPFYLYKFRSMTDERDGEGKLLSDHLRLTPFGQLLRKLSLDELPQLFNVVRGELSLVGPRPLLMDYLPLYTEEQAKRHLVRPGITGWAQVNGRNAVTWDDRFDRDVWYVENRTFWLDMRILLLTVKRVLRSDGISNGNHVTMPLFDGQAHNQKG
ncbi:sugar transferase [Paenibacillus sp. LHD-117]|uniref:sugar transferase n=1 Tax=Paenibacillus sp. LHD-117 TaxID=3071412 RepID=UPI0027DF3BF9|nr:sugar transferase [Paenibacillus sp. LHD-117]MDQ6423268.1 sugar transferase [Paenibacillus sp. LHD-117]